MQRNRLRSILLPFLLSVILLLTAFLINARSCRLPSHTVPAAIAAPKLAAMPTHVEQITLPAGYERVACASGSFGAWLRTIGIKKDKTVYLYNGQPKKNQEAQYAVLNIPVGNKDLQQCADAVMRLRAQYLYSQQRFAEIWFSDNNGKKYVCPPHADSTRFERYLETVYASCGTLSLAQQLRPVANFSKIQSGDVLIKGGSPGHAVLVMDVAVNKAGEKIYLLSQSYMPAQDIHVLKNPVNHGLSPWYRVVNDNAFVYTPEWTFATTQLRRW